MVVWLLAAGTGVSYSVVAERRNRLSQLGEMEHSLKRLAYYMYQWRLPIKDAIAYAAKEEKDVLQKFYLGLHETLVQQQTEDFDMLWQEESGKIWNHIPEEIQRIWNESFVNIPMEPEALNKRLTERAERIADYVLELQEKYKGEQKLVFTMGFFVSAFFCLILW